MSKEVDDWKYDPQKGLADVVEAEFKEEFEEKEEEKKMDETELSNRLEREEDKKEETTEEKKERYIDILVGIGFQKAMAKGDGKERFYYKINDNSAVGRTFDSRTPLGKFWCKENNDFLKEDECKEIAIVKQFYAVRDGEEKMPERPKEIVKREPTTGTAIIPRAGKMVIPALNKTISELGLQEDIDYFARGGKLVFAKEGELKLAAASKHRVRIETVELEAEPNKFLPMQLYVRLRGWAENEEGKTIWETEESNNWSYLNERMRFITKKIRDGRWTKDRDYTIEYNEDGTISKLSPTVATMFEVEEYMMDKQKYALRTIIGETKRRIWGEFLGVTQSDRRELQFEREEFDRIQKERVKNEVKAVAEG